MEETQLEIQKRLEQAGEQAHLARYKLSLYVTGNTPRSVRAISNLQQVIKEHLLGRVDLEIIDVYQQDAKSLQTASLVATPMLVKNLPLPLRRLIGDLSNEGKVLMALDLGALNKGI